jgi:hypothetical protein
MPQNVRQYGCISKGHDEIIRMLASYENGRGINHPPAQALIEELVLVVREEQTDIGLGVDVIDNASHDGGRVPLTSERWVRHDCGHAADSQPAGVSPGSVDLKHFGMTYEEVASRSDKCVDGGSSQRRSRSLSSPRNNALPHVRRMNART